MGPPTVLEGGGDGGGGPAIPILNRKFSHCRIFSPQRLVAKPGLRTCMGRLIAIPVAYQAASHSTKDPAENASCGPHSGPHRSTQEAYSSGKKQLRARPFFLPRRVPERDSSFRLRPAEPSLKHNWARDWQVTE